MTLSMFCRVFGWLHTCMCVCMGGGGGCVPGHVCCMCTTMDAYIKGEVKAKIKISPVVVFGVLSRMVLVRES